MVEASVGLRLPKPTTFMRSLRLVVGLRSSGRVVSMRSVSVIPTASTTMKRSLCSASIGDRLEVGVVHDPRAASEHLLEVGAALDRRA